MACLLGTGAAFFGLRFLGIRLRMEYVSIVTIFFNKSICLYLNSFESIFIDEKVPWWVLAMRAGLKIWLHCE